MDTLLAETRQLETLNSDSVDLKQTLDGSLPNSPSPPPPTQTLDDLLYSSAVPLEPNADDSSNYDYLSPCLDETLDDRSDSALFLDVGSQEDEEDDPLHSLPVNTVPPYNSSHWSSAPWDSCRDTDTWGSSSSDFPPARDTEPLTSDWSETRPSGGDTKPLESGWSEPCDLQEELETKPLVSVYPARCSKIKPAIVGAGLANLGNTCFLNAVLQCFTHTVPLIQALCSYKHPRPCERHSEGFCVLCSLRNHIELSLDSMGTVVYPWELVENLSYFSSNFQRFQQEDAHEFLQCLLDRLDSCCTYSKMKNTTLSSVNESLVQQVFGGRLISKLQCCNCGHCSDTYEPLIDLSLEIENVNTLPSALESFTKLERIEDSETKFTCENCKEGVSIEKQLVLDQAPSVATFHLKRFKNDGFYVEKIDKHVEFPLELDLFPYTSGSQNKNVELKYDLYAIVVHFGLSSTCGHYYCFVRSAPDAWYRLDDSKVARVQEEFVLSQEAYILFYAKQGTPWLSSFFVETEKSSSNPNISNNSPKSVLENMDHICTSSPNVTNNPSYEVNKAREDAVGSFNGCRQDGVEGDEAKDDPDRLCTPVPLGMGGSSIGTSYKVEKFSPSALRENNCNQDFNEVKNRPRSPSPDICAEEPPVESYSIPRGHLISEKQASCKRQLDKDLEDSQKKQARKLLKKMPNDRSSKLLAAMDGSHIEGALNRKKSRGMELSSNKKDRPSSTRNKPNLNSFMHPVAAGSLR